MNGEARVAPGPVGRGTPQVAPRNTRPSWFTTLVFAGAVLAIVAAGVAWAVRRVQTGMPTRPDPNPVGLWREHRHVGPSADYDVPIQAAATAATAVTPSTGGVGGGSALAPPPLPDGWRSQEASSVALPPLPAAPTPPAATLAERAHPVDDTLLVSGGAGHADALVVSRAASEPPAGSGGQGQPWQSDGVVRRWSRAGRADATLSAGNTIDCVLQTRLDSTLPGITTCVVTRDVYSDDGTRILVARGSLATGEYRATLLQGQRRLFVLWTRIRTPAGLLLQLDAPATDALGASGVAGDVDEHWFERIGAAFMLSFIQDAIGLAVQQRADAGGTGQTFVFPATAQTGSQMADRVLQNTINIAPTLTKNPGDRILIMVAHDLDLSGAR